MSFDLPSINPIKTTNKRCEQVKKLNQICFVCAIGNILLYKTAFCTKSANMHSDIQKRSIINKFQFTKTSRLVPSLQKFYGLGFIEDPTVYASQ